MCGRECSRTGPCPSDHPLESRCALPLVALCPGPCPSQPWLPPCRSRPAACADNKSTDSGGVYPANVLHSNILSVGKTSFWRSLFP